MADTRNFTRKPIRGQVFFVLPGVAPIRGRAKDLSLGGICVLLGDQVPVGARGTVALETTHEGKVVHFAAKAKVVYSILSGADGFRTGLQFMELDPENDKTLAILMI